MIDQATIEQIKNAANIVDVVADYVSLHRAGANYKGLCPFHNERTPSFIVSPAKNFCHCFGCGKGGDPIRFLMDLNNYSYPEALMHLANKFHIEVKEVDMTSEEIAERHKRQTYLTLCDFAAQYYQKCLGDECGNEAIALLNSLNIHESVAKKFSLGFAPAEKDSLTKAITKAGFSNSYATDLGLVASIDGGISDIINYAIVLPVFNKTGKVTAFAWNGLDQTDTNLLVTARSPIFNAQEAIYGIYQAHHAISKNKCCHIVDSPYDVLSMHQNGLENTIAPLGNSIDRYAITDISRCVSSGSVSIITADLSAQSIQRTFTIIDQFVAQGISVFVNVISYGSISQAIAEMNASDWQQHLDQNRSDAVLWKAKYLLTKASNDTERVRAIHSCLRTVKVMRNETSKQIYLNELSKITHFPSSILYQEMGNLK